MDELAQKRARHNEVEIRRRQKIADRFDELKELTGINDAKNKGAILAAAIDQIADNDQEIARLERRLKKGQTKSEN
jgi:hypothetical protein